MACLKRVVCDGSHVLELRVQAEETNLIADAGCAENNAAERPRDAHVDEAGVLL